MTRAALAIAGLAAVFAASFGAGSIVSGGDPSRAGVARALPAPRPAPQIRPLTSPPRLPELRTDPRSSSSPAGETPSPSDPGPGASAPPPPPPPPPQQPVLPPDPVPR